MVDNLLGPADVVLKRLVTMTKTGEIRCARCGGHPKGLYSIFMDDQTAAGAPEDGVRFNLTALCHDCLLSGEIRQFVERMVAGGGDAGKCDEVAL